MAGMRDAGSRPASGRGRQERGRANYEAGASAELGVEGHYTSRGYEARGRRWRSSCGEIDLIFEKSGEVVFVEVKSSSTHARAAASLSPSQVARLLRSAEQYIGGMPRGGLTPMRFDVALVDRTGQLEVIENALAA